MFNRHTGHSCCTRENNLTESGGEHPQKSVSALQDMHNSDIHMMRLPNRTNQLITETKKIMEHKIAEPNARVDVADVLRGLAVMGIILLHSIEHFNFYSFPKEVPFL